MKHPTTDQGDSFTKITVTISRAQLLSMLFYQIMVPPVLPSSVTLQPRPYCHHELLHQLFIPLVIKPDRVAKVFVVEKCRTFA
jgi:hypothetical protein